MGDLFGGKTQTTDPKTMMLPTMTGEQLGVLANLSTILQGQIGKGVESYPGTYTPGASDTQNLQYDYIKSLFDRGNVNSPLTTLDSIMGPYDMSSAKNWWEQSVRAPAMETWDDVKAKVLEPFAGMDAMDSGASRRALAEAGATMNTDITGKLADVLYQGEQGHLNRQLQGLQFPLNLTTALNVPGATEREISTQQGQEQYQDWMMSQPWANPWLNQLPTALGAKAFENVVIPGQTTQTKGGGLGEILSGVGGLAGGIGKLFMGGAGAGFW